MTDADGAFGGGNDARAQLRFLDNDGNAIDGPKETQVVEEGCADPEWCEEFIFDKPAAPAVYTLKVAARDRDPMCGIDAPDCLAANDWLGAAKLDWGALAYTTDLIDHRLVVARGWFSDPMVAIAASTGGCWGN